jgi:alpha-D-ribose 1-methylphosphonate 5-triphosphate synthase subunit PhnH
MFGKHTVSLVQEIFRTLMNSFSKPGKVFDLSKIKKSFNDQNISSLNIFYALCYTLMDNETTYTVIGKDAVEEMIENIYKLTKSKYVSVEKADFVFISGYSSGKSLENINIGTSLFPDRGATVFYFVKNINNGKGYPLTISGPGIMNKICFTIEGSDLYDLEIISNINKEFPLGIDVVFYDLYDRILSVPRSSKIILGD